MLRKLLGFGCMKTSQIWPTYKTDWKPILVSLNPNPNMPWILVENKVLIRSKQALDYNWNNKNKTHKLILYAVVRREEENQIIQVWYKAYLNTINSSFLV